MPACVRPMAGSGHARLTLAVTTAQDPVDGRGCVRGGGMNKGTVSRGTRGNQSYKEGGIFISATNGGE